MWCCGKKAVEAAADADDRPLDKPNEEMSMDNQNFAELKQQCLQAKKLFVDPTFPPGPRSLYFHGVTPPGRENIKWKRPMDIVRHGKPSFIVGGASHHDLQQGKLGNCWFIAATSTLATFDKKKFAKVVPHDQHFNESYAGIFHFNFWWYGKWVDVVIDDFLPTVNNGLIFCKNRAQPNEFWAALLEKAYAKLHGCYESLDGGNIQDAFVDLTGGISESFSLHNRKTLPPNIYELIRKSLRMNSLIGAAIYLPENSAHLSEVRLSNGLYQGHAYSMTGMVQVQLHTGDAKVSLMRLRNPWGRGEWNGPWSDRSPEMKSLTPQQKEKLHLVALDDGEFWMSFEDVMKNFDEIAICHMHPDALSAEMMTDSDKDEWYVTMFHDAWIKELTAGGCGNSGFESLYWTNPQFYVELTEADADSTTGFCTMIISLMEKEANRKQKIAINLDVYRLRTKFPVHLNQKNNHQLSIRQKKEADIYQYNREMTNHFNIAPGIYIIIPSTFQPYQEAKFLLRIYTKARITSGIVDKNPTIPMADGPTEEPFERLFRVYARDEKMGAREMKRFLADFSYKEFKRELKFSLDTCRSILAMMDRNRSGKLSLEEMKSAWKEIKVYHDLFLSSDRNGTGFIETYEMNSLLQKLGIRVDNNVLKAIAIRYGGMQKAISWTDFIQISCKLTTMENIFEEYKVSPQKDVAQFTKAEFFNTFLLY